MSILAYATESEGCSSHVIFRLAGLLMSRHARVGCLQLEDSQYGLFNPCQLSARYVRGLTIYPAHRLETPRQLAK
jgi:hypothetical protein